MVVTSSPNLVCDHLSPPTTIYDVITREIGEGELYTRPEKYVVVELSTQVSGGETQ